MESIIGSNERILVKQVKEWGEILTGFETRNRFEIVDEDGTKLGYAAEEGGGLGTMLLRNLLGQCRACRVHLYDPEGKQLGVGVKPFRFYFHRMEIEEGDQKIGAVQRRFSILHRKFVLEDADGKEILEITSPFLRIWTFKVHMDDVEVARISKKWGGVLKEMFTDADAFGIEFLRKDLPLTIKKLLIGAVFLIDFTCFERKQ